MKKKIINGLLMVALLGATTSSFVSCKDYQEDEITDIRGLLSDQDTQLRALVQNRYEALQERLAKIKECNCPADLDQIINDLQARLSRVEANQGQGGTYDPTSLLTKLNEVNTIATQAAEAVRERGRDIETLKGQVENLEAIKVAWGEKLDQAYVNAANALVRVQLLEQQVSNLPTGQADLTEVNKRLKELEEAKENLEKADKLLNKALEEVKGSITTVEATLGEVEKAYKAADAKLASDIEALKSDVEALKAKIDGVLAKLVTGVIVQGTVNPVIGYAALPNDTRSTVLAAYYGKAVQGVEFPSARPKFYANPDEAQVLTEEDLERLNVKNVFKASAGDLLSTGNAGKIYLTVNPNTVNFEDITVSLVNSLDEESPVKLSPLKKSSQKLTFGWTRSADNNGFYEADATIATKDLTKAETNIDLPALGDAIQDVISQRSKGSLSSLVATLYSNASDILDANGVKAAWTDANGEHAVYSQYNVAATVIQPLSFGFAKDVDASDITSKVVAPISRIQQAIDKAIDDIKLGNINIGVDASKIQDISFDLGDDNGQYVISKDIDIDEQGIPVDIPVNITVVVNGQTGTGTGSATGTVTSPAVHETITINLYPYLQDIMSSMNGKLAGLNDVLSGISGGLDLDAQINSAKGSIKTQLKSYFDRINSAASRLSSLINNANKVLQLTTTYVGADGNLYLLSSSKEDPTVFSGDGDAIVVYPTSYSAEMFAPAFKKFVAVTNVYKNGRGIEENASLKIVLDEVNSSNDQLNTVIDGGQYGVAIGNLRKGYVYEIVYSALDYSGLNAAKKFYVEVK